MRNRSGIGRVSATALWLAILWVAWLILQIPYTIVRAYGDNLSSPHGVESLERALFGGIAPTRLLQERIYMNGVPWLDHAAYLSHGFWFGVPFALGLVLMIYQRDKLLPFLGWQIVLFHVSAVVFLVFPVRPPWMEEGVSRVLTEINAYDYTVVDNNPAAAFPSLHAGLPALVTMFLFLECRPKLRFYAWLAASFTLVVSVAIVYLGEHWAIDVLAGYLVAAVTAVGMRSHLVRRIAHAVPGDPLGRLGAVNHRLLSTPPNEPIELPSPAIGERTAA